MSRAVTILGVEETAQLVTDGPVKVRSIQFHNNAAAASYLQLFNARAAGDVTVGTTLADWAGGIATLEHLQLTGLELIFGKGLVLAMTTTPNGNTGPSADVLALALGIDDG